MKTEAEIRQHRDDIRILKDSPCSCGPEHKIACICGGKMLEAVDSTLSWLLGENEYFQQRVDEVREGLENGRWL